MLLLEEIKEQPHCLDMFHLPMLSYGMPLPKSVLKQNISDDISSKSPSGTSVALRQMLLLIIKERSIAICKNGVQ